MSSGFCLKFVSLLQHTPERPLPGLGDPRAVSAIFQKFVTVTRGRHCASSVIDTRLFGQRTLGHSDAAVLGAGSRHPQHRQCSDEGLPWCNQDINGKFGYHSETVPTIIGQWLCRRPLLP
jgi:hypothetical protein